MTVSRFTITHAGPQITVQDSGRFGMLHYGVPPSGAVDRMAFHNDAYDGMGVRLSDPSCTPMRRWTCRRNRLCAGLGRNTKSCLFVRHSYAKVIRDRLLLDTVQFEAD